jgi:predicted enzyme related to lactoylglutathione lyase
MSEQAAAAEQMAMPKHGQFCWNELATSNLEESKNFYSELFGWDLQKSDATGMEYYEFGSPGGQRVGGMWQITDDCGGAESTEKMSPRWMSYIAVDDVDRSAAKVAELGGNICVPPTDIPNVGRFCVINDPSGATFSLVTLKQ